MIKKTTALILLFCLPLMAGVQFDATDDFLTVASDASLDAVTVWSVSVWIYVDTDNLGIILGRQNAATGNGWQIYFDGANNNITADGGNTGDLTTTSATNSISLNTWYNVIAVWNESGPSVKIYIDGVQSGSEGTTGAVDDGTGEPLVVGKKGTIFFFGGIINEAACWDAVLTTAEISLIADSKTKRTPLQIQPANLQAYWALDDEPDGTSVDANTFIDLSGTGNTATGDDGANNTGLTAKAEEILSYP